MVAKEKADSECKACQGLTPEARLVIQEFAGVYSQNVQLAITGMEQRLTAKIEATRTELKAEIGEVRTTLKEHGGQLTEHGEAIAGVRARLEEGEKRFEDHEKRIAETEKATQSTALGIAKLAGAIGAAGVGGAFAGALAKVLGG